MNHATRTVKTVAVRRLGSRISRVTGFRRRTRENRATELVWCERRTNAVALRIRYKADGRTPRRPSGNRDRRNAKGDRRVTGGATARRVRRSGDATKNHFAWFHVFTDVRVARAFFMLSEGRTKREPCTGSCTV